MVIWDQSKPISLIAHPSNNHTFMPYIGLYVLAPSIHSLFYVTTALLISDVSGTEKNKDPRVLDLQGWD